MQYLKTQLSLCRAPDQRTQHYTCTTLVISLLALSDSDAASAPARPTAPPAHSSCTLACAHACECIDLCIHHPTPSVYRV